MSSLRSRKRRQAQRHDVEAEEQVFAERALLNGVAQILVGGGDDADVGLDRRAAADGRVFALLQHPEQARLRLHRHVADLVEEQRAALGLLEAARRARVGAGEGALLMAEQLALDQVARDRRHVDGDERPGLALAVIVQRARDQFLAGARLAGNHHRQVGLHQPRQRAENVLHRRRAADQRHQLGRRRFRADFARAFRLREGAADDRHQLLQVERLGQVFVGPALGRLDRGHEGVLRAHDDDRQIRPHALDARQQLERVVVGHHHVGDDEIALAGGDPAPQAGDGAGRAHFIAGARQRLIENRPDRRVVVGDENMP